MTNYNDGEWHGWNGGECPVHPKSEVQVAIYEGKAVRKFYAIDYKWDHQRDYPEGNIVAFRVIKEHREPREFWAVEMPTIDMKTGKHMFDNWVECPQDTKDAILFREVIQ